METRGRSRRKKTYGSDKTRKSAARYPKKRSRKRTVSRQRYILGRIMSAVALILTLLLLAALLFSGIRWAKGGGISRLFERKDASTERIAESFEGNGVKGEANPAGGREAGDEPLGGGLGGSGGISGDNADIAENTAAEGEPEGGNEESLSETKQGSEPQGGDNLPVKMLFAGDVYLSGYVLEAYDKAGGISGVLDETYRNLINEADVFVSNMEFPMSSGGEAADKEFTFRVSPDRVNILKEMGIDAVTLANNHTLDYGVSALLDTIDTLDKAGISHTGAGADIEKAGEAAIKEINGKRIAFLGAGRVIPYSDWAAGKSSPGLFLAYDAYKEKLLKKIEELDVSCDFVAVYLHWGTEKKEEPDSYMKPLAQEIAEAGADLIIGAHPHVLQGTEYVNGVPVVYSLGNFVFGSSIPRMMLLEVSWYPETGGTNLRIYPGKSSFGYTKALTEQEAKEEFYGYYEGLSFGVSMDGEGNISKKTE